MYLAMKCLKCGSNNEDDNLLCVGCGDSLSGMNKWFKIFIWIFVGTATVGLLVPSCYAIL